MVSNVFDRFQETWKCLEGDEKTQAKTILCNSDVSDFKIGKTKVVIIQNM